jgi:hypothetical protein
MKSSVLISCFLLPELFILLPLSSSAQVAFERTYGGSDRDVGSSVQQNMDGGYIIAGWTESFGSGNFDVYLIKTDSLGDTLWTMTSGNPIKDFGISVQQTSDGGYIIAGITEFSGARDIYLVKTTSLGDTLWTRTYGGTDLDEGLSVQQTVPDGGYIITGYTKFSFGADSDAVYLLKTDSLGDTLWTRTYGGTGPDGGRSVQQTSDGGYIITGFTESFGAGISDVYLIKTDSSGDTLWTRTYGGTAWDEGRSVQQTLDGGYIITGRTSSFGAGGVDVYLIKTDSLGETLWTKAYGGTDGDFGYSVRQTLDGGYIIAGYSFSFDPWGDVYLIKTNSQGDTLWTRNYGGSDPELSYSVQQTMDGGYILTGLTRSFGSGESDVYLIKIEGREVHNGGVIALDAPGDTVFTDSTYAVMATVRNFGNMTETFDAIASIDGYSDTILVAGLAPDSDTQLVFSNWTVPSTDSFTYTMTVCTYVALDADPTNDCRTKSIFAYIPLGVEEDSDSRYRISDYRLYQNYPNPFHFQTIIHYQIPIGGYVSLKVYDLTGRLVETLVDKRQESGVYQVKWEGKGQSIGIYFYRLQSRIGQACDFTATKKIILLK